MNRRLLAYVLRALTGLTLLGFGTTPAWVCDAEDGVFTIGHEDDDFDWDDADDWEDLFDDDDD